ncbi:hypothetical protein FHR77_002520 [Frigoribacterium endophyticum]|nr:hypothetical protein [Frigoribacterium endophyticum]
MDGSLRFRETPFVVSSSAMSVAQRAGKAVELRDHQDVAGTAGSEGLAEAWPCSSGARKAVVNMDVLIVNTECCEILSREVETRGSR